jgi:hypothetical protein
VKRRTFFKAVAGGLAGAAVHPGDGAVTTRKFVVMSETPIELLDNPSWLRRRRREMAAEKEFFLRERYSRVDAIERLPDRECLQGDRVLHRHAWRVTGVVREGFA